MEQGDFFSSFPVFPFGFCVFIFLMGFYFLLSCMSSLATQNVGLCLEAFCCYYSAHFLHVMLILVKFRSQQRMYAIRCTVWWVSWFPFLFSWFPIGFSHWIVSAKKWMSHLSLFLYLTGEHTVSVVKYGFEHALLSARSDFGSLIKSRFLPFWIYND